MNLPTRTLCILFVIVFMHACMNSYMAYGLSVKYDFSGVVIDVQHFDNGIFIGPSANIGDPFHGNLSIQCDPGMPPYFDPEQVNALMWTGMQIDYTVYLGDFAYETRGYESNAFLLFDSSDPGVKDRILIADENPLFFGNYPEPFFTDPMVFMITYKNSTTFNSPTLPNSLHLQDIESFLLYPNYNYYDPYTKSGEITVFTLAADPVSPSPVPEPPTMVLFSSFLFLSFAALKKRLIT